MNITGSNLVALLATFEGEDQSISRYCNLTF